VVGTIKNYNDMLGDSGVFGIKTGSTSQAGGNLLFASHLTVGDTTLTVIGAVFNQPGSNTPTQLAQVNKVVRKLLAAVRKVVKEYTILGTKPVGTVTTAWGDSITVSPADSLKVIGWPGLTVPVSLTTSAPGADVPKDTVVGAVEARPGTSGIRVELRTDAATTKPSLWWKLTRKP
jgi:D-alanyl-D-alanine carboxypeptidase (penicillin-binding protein 5/6)